MLIDVLLGLKLKNRMYKKSHAVWHGMVMALNRFVVE
jgi:hypothetical protein